MIAGNDKVLLFMLLLSIGKKQCNSSAGSSMCQKDSLTGKPQTRLVERLAKTMTYYVFDFLGLRPSSESFVGHRNYLDDYVTCVSCIWHRNVCTSVMESPDMIFNFCF